MAAIDLIPIAALTLGLIASAIIVLLPRFGPSSWLLSLFLIPAALASGVLALPSISDNWQAATALRVSFSLLIIAMPLGVFFSYSLSREDYLNVLKKRRFSTGLIILVSLLLTALLDVVPTPEDLLPPEGSVALGLYGYVAALCLLLGSVLGLANLEQSIRSAHEHIRWEIKFLLLGLAGIFASIIYISSKVLLYPPAYGLVASESFRLFSVLFLLSSILILVSWRRSSGRVRVVVSQKVIYSTITLISVGLYLVVSSVLARWAGQWIQFGLPTEALVFLLSILALSVILLWTAFRHRAVWWIRRHFLAGSYDYRQYWIEASERIRALDSPEIQAEALLDIVQRALGAIDISVWARLWNPNRLKLMAARGTIAEGLNQEVSGIVEKIIEMVEPVSSTDVELSSAEDPVARFIAKTHGAVLAPLQSGGRMVGLLTVGRDRSGRPYGWEAKEFLGVLARHAAGEFHKSEFRTALLQAKETEAFGAFSTFLLHDLKNFASTLTLIAGNAAKHQDNPDFQRDAFQSVFNIAEKMKRLCNNLRMFSSASTGAKKLDDLNYLIRTVADTLNVEMSGSLRLHLGELPLVAIDAEEITRLLKNLLLNARAAISDSGAICLGTRYHDSMVEVSIEDNGCGMKAEFLQRELFLPFHTTKSDGLGIGLFHSKKIVEAHNGTIQVESEEGKGTTVRILLPVPQAELDVIN